jgi:hypothetical protein
MGSHGEYCVRHAAERRQDEIDVTQGRKASEAKEPRDMIISET